MNLVPFPNLHFLVPSIAPIYSVVKTKLPPRPLDQMFSDVLMPEYQLLDCNPKQNRYLAVGLMIRGDVSFSDVSRYSLFF
jgi:tubulin epsilon